MSERYDLAVIGSGPAASGGPSPPRSWQARCHHRPAGALGGVCCTPGPSQQDPARGDPLSQRKARAQLTGPTTRSSSRSASRTFAEGRPGGGATAGGVRDQIRRNSIDFVDGLVRFVDPHTLEVEREDGRRGGSRRTTSLTPAARGPRGGRTPVRPRRHPRRRPDRETTEGVLPGSVVVIGGGVIGLEYASMLAAMGIAVTLVDTRAELLESSTARSSATCSITCGSPAWHSSWARRSPAVGGAGPRA